MGSSSAIQNHPSPLEGREEQSPPGYLGGARRVKAGASIDGIEVYQTNPLANSFKVVAKQLKL